MADKPVYVVVTPFFPSPQSWRGAYCLDFVKALMRTGRYRVVVFTEGRGGDYEIEGIKVHVFRATRLPSNVFPMLFSRCNQRRFLAAVARSGINFADVAICHANTANYGIYALAMKGKSPMCKALLHHHDLASFGLNTGRLHRCWLYNAIQYPILRRMHEAIDLHVFVSEVSRKSFLSVPNTDWTGHGDYKAQYRGLGFYRSPRIKRSLVLPNGVDTMVFNVDAGDEGMHSRPRASFVVGCIGNFEELKGQSTLIRAVGRIGRIEGKRLEVVFVGSGPTLEECKRIAKDVQREDGEIRFEFKTEMSHGETAAFYRTLDLFVLPSCFEGFGCVYTEAYACGVPYICCRGQGISELTPDEWMVDAGDVEGLARKIRWVISQRPSMVLTGEYRVNPLLSYFIQQVETVVG